MSNRNFDSRAIIQRLQNQVYARNLYANNTTGQTLINNPQTTDGNSSRYASYHSGSQTEYARGLIGDGETVSVGGIVGITQIPAPSINEPTSDIFTFTTVGTTTWTAPLGITSIQYLVVGGGGGSGGGFDTGGGGGGGGGMVLYGTLSVIPGNTYTVVVGDGGDGGISIRSPVSETNGTAGSNSSFDSTVALGGGGGYASRSGNPSGNSAGGAAVSNRFNTSSEGGNGGGNAGDGNGAGGGGGGSLGFGSNGVSNTGGNGGNGVLYSISGTSVSYGNGGRGANGNSNNAATPGASNTGNGASGGGAISFADENGAKGGSGIVIIKLL